MRETEPAFIRQNNNNNNTNDNDDNDNNININNNDHTNNNVTQNRYKKSNKINWDKILNRNNGIILSNTLNKKLLKCIRHLSERTRISREIQNIAQNPLFNSPSPITVPGVIYAIIHLPTSKIYVGQTINSSFHRFKQHWHNRNKGDFRNKSLHEKMRNNSTIYDYIIWPLELINPELYVIDGNKDKLLFRNCAAVRETFWINLLRTLQPNGFNIILPNTKSKSNRRAKRPGRLDNRRADLPDRPPRCTSCVQNIDGNILIHTHAGLDNHIRRLLQKMLTLEDNSINAMKNELSKVSKHILLKTLHWISQNVKAAQINERLRSITSIIRDINTRTYESKKKKTVFNDFIKLVHANEAIKYTNIRKILREPEICRLLPDALIPRICNKHVSPNSTFYCNFTKACKNLSPLNLLPPPSEGCSCKDQLEINASMLVDGHVMTTDYHAIRNRDLRQEFCYGAKYKHNMSLNTIMESVNLGLRQFVEYVTKKVSKDVAQVNNLELWRSQVSKLCQDNLNANQISMRDENSQNITLLRDVRSLQEHFVITKVDKLSHNLALTCKKYYLHKLFKEINSDSYTPANLDLTEVLQRHKVWNDAHKYKHNENLPYLYAVPKMHKNPPKFRYIAGVASVKRDQDPQQPRLSNVERVLLRSSNNAACSTTEASKALSKYLQTIMEVLTEKDKVLYNMHGYRRCWFVTNIDNAFIYIKDNVVLLKDKSPRTFDFTTMYTQLKHDRIINNVGWAIQEAFTYLSYKNSQMLSILPSFQIIMSHVNFIVKNTYLCNNDDNIKYQSIGIPMGTNAAPELANLTLYCDEAMFIDKLVAENRRQEAQSYCHTMRYIDDMLLWGNVPPSQEAYSLEYSEQTLADGSVTFLGAKITKLTNGYIQTLVFDKTMEWNFPVVRYSHADSNVPSNQSSNIYLSQLIRYTTICNSIRMFKKATSILTQRILERKHSPRSIIFAWNRFLLHYHSRHYKHLASLRTWFRKMMKWCSYNTKDPMSYRPAATVVAEDVPALLAPIALIHEGQLNHNAAAAPANANMEPSRAVDAPETVHADNIADAGPKIDALLRLYKDDPIFQRYSSFMRRVLTKNEQRCSGAIARLLSVCPVCTQHFMQLVRHRDPQGKEGCYNVARMRAIICIKKGIVFTHSALVPFTNIDELESHFNEEILSSQLSQSSNLSS